MKEKNKETLDQSIAGLPQYSPPEIIWKGIDLQLGTEESTERFVNVVNTLPVYKAPEGIWGQIENDLEVEHEVPGKVVAFPAWKKWSAVAAALVLGLLANWNLMTSNNKATIQYSYAEEVIEDDLLAPDWGQDEAAFEMVMEFCKVQQIACQEPVFKNLKAELEDLNEARSILFTAMENYGKDAEMVARLIALELERTDVLKKMIARI